MTTRFGERIRELRIKHDILLRQMAAKMDMDPSIISKVERGERRFRREHISLLAKILLVDEQELLMLWLADQIINLVKDEQSALKAMKVAEQEIKYNRKI